MREKPIDRLMRLAEAFGAAMSHAGYTQGYRARETPHGSPEERRLYDKEMAQWVGAGEHRDKLRRAIQRALANAKRTESPDAP